LLRTGTSFCPAGCAVVQPASLFGVFPGEDLGLNRKGGLLLLPPRRYSRCYSELVVLYCYSTTGVSPSVRTTCSCSACFCQMSKVTRALYSPPRVFAKLFRLLPRCNGFRCATVQSPQSLPRCLVPVVSLVKMVSRASTSSTGISVPNLRGASD
jgi:hypothetical protein